MRRRVFREDITETQTRPDQNATIERSLETYRLNRLTASEKNA